LARLVIDDQALADADRLLDHLVRSGVADAGERIAAVLDSLGVLRTNPQIGRPKGSGHRELVIGKRSRGYLALYRYDELDDLVLVLVLRSQSELGYAGPTRG